MIGGWYECESCREAVRVYVGLEYDYDNKCPFCFAPLHVPDQQTAISHPITKKGRRPGEQRPRC